MGKKKKELGFDSDGAKKVMRKRDYMADMSGQLALGLMANVVGQLTYFYTDKVGLALFILKKTSSFLGFIHS